MLIKGLQKLSLIDYPDKVCAVLFVAGCNLRCPYCQNPDLVNHGKLPEIDESELLSWLKDKRKWLDGVCVTGGEPTLYNDLPIFLSKVKSLGFLVKLDTNGTNPNLLRNVIKKGLVNYIAMDVKAPLRRYKEVVKVDVDLKKIQESIDLIRTSGVDYEFRTTVVPRLLSKEDLLAVCAWLKGSKRYYLQQFRPKITLDKSYEEESSYSESELLQFKKLAEPFFEATGVRGV